MTEIGMIPGDWEVKKLKDVTQVITKGTTPTTLGKDFVSKGINFIKVESISADGTFLNKKFEHIDKETNLLLKRSIIEEDDILFSIAGAIGRTTIVDKNILPANTNQAIAIIRLKKDVVIPQFIRYLLSNPKTIEQMKSKVVQSVQANLSLSIISDSEIPIPELTEQKSISKILLDLDSKIALNRQMNATLERIGQALFKQWFVDFEFPNEEGKPYKSSGGEMVDSELGEVPKGWEVVALSKIAEFTRGFSYAGSEKSKEAGEYVFMTLNSIYEGGGFKREFSYLTSERLKERHLVKEGDIIIANTEQTKTGTLLGFPALVEFPLNYDKTVGVYSHHITKVIPFREEEKHYLHHYLNFYQSKAIKYHIGSVIWALDVNGWANNEKIMLPKKEILITFSRLMNIIFQRRLMNNKESNSLENIRDSLLPKLMSGEIRVNSEVSINGRH